VIDSITPSPVVQYFEGSLEVGNDDLVEAVDRLVRHADEARRLAVRANADTPEDAERARRFGAMGIGLCRTEHMFLGDRRKLVETLVLAEGEDEQEQALAALLPLQREDFIGILRAMDGLPVTVRLIDPPLHVAGPEKVTSPAPSTVPAARVVLPLPRFSDAPAAARSVPVFVIDASEVVSVPPCTSIKPEFVSVNPSPVMTDPPDPVCVIVPSLLIAWPGPPAATGCPRCRRL
jgi:hypothetical protein